MPHPPRLDPVLLSDLGEGDHLDLRPRELIEALRFSGLWDDVDLTDAEFSECLLDRVIVGDVVWRGVRVAQSRIEGLDAPVLAASRSVWREVEIRSSRIGSAELYDSELRSVSVSASKLGYVNLRGSRATDVVFDSCTIDELDLGSVTADRVALRDCRIGVLTVTGSTFTNVDVRGSDLSGIHGVAGLAGVTIDDTQLAQLAPLLAAEAGISVA